MNPLILKTLNIIILILALSNCTGLVVRPQVLYEDGALYKRVQKQKKELHKVKNPKAKDVNNILNDYDTLVNKYHFTINKNNERALK